MAAQLLNGREATDDELAAVEHGRECERKRDLVIIAGLLPETPYPVHEGRHVTSIEVDFGGMGTR